MNSHRGRWEREKHMPPWVAEFSTSATTDKILSFIKSLSFRPVEEILPLLSVLRFLPLVEMTLVYL